MTKILGHQKGLSHEIGRAYVESAMDSPTLKDFSNLLSSWLLAALGLSSGRSASAATAIYSVFRPNLEIPHKSAGGVF